MRRSTFCWVPPGQRYGDARRHITAAFHGCIPVFSVPDGHHTLEEVLPWERMSLHVPPEQLPQLPAILDNVSATARDAMRTELRGWRHALWYSSIYGECTAAPDAPPRAAAAPRDAFEGLMRLLARRLPRA